MKLVTVILLFSTALLSQNRSDVHPFRPVHTFSIVCRDPATGDLGVAVQSHWFSVGSIVPWAESGVGAVATQSFVDPSYGKLGLDLMRAGRSAPETLAGLLAADNGRDVRQVAMIDSQGRVAAHLTLVPKELVSTLNHARKACQHCNERGESLIDHSPQVSF